MHICANFYSLNMVLVVKLIQLYLNLNAYYQLQLKTMQQYNSL